MTAAIAARLEHVCVEGRQLAEAGPPGIFKRIHGEAQHRQLLLPRRRQLARLPGVPLHPDPCAQACMWMAWHDLH